MTQTEALKLALEALEQIDPYVDQLIDYSSTAAEYPLNNASRNVARAITAIKEALSSPDGEAQPEQEQNLKLMPREATPEMLKAMDECSTEGYDERLHAGHAGSVYMAAWDAFHGQHCYCGDITSLGVIHRDDGPCHYPEHTSEYKRGYADAMNWKVQNHLEHLPAAQPEQEPVAWMYQDKSTHQVSFQKHMKAFVDHSKTSEVPLYGKPLANHELQCVCGAVWCGDEMVHLPNKTPPQPKQDKERCVGCEACIDTACGRDECPKGWPKAAKPEQEPYGYFKFNTGKFYHEVEGCNPKTDKRYLPLYRNPPQRKPLTDEQIDFLNFLYGAGEWDGVWFEGKHPTKKGAFWWREDMKRLFDYNNKEK